LIATKYIAKFTFTFIVLVGFFTLVSAQNRSIEQVQVTKKTMNDCQLVFGWDIVKPYQYLNELGEAEGFQIELIKSIVKEFECKVEFRQLVWYKLLEQIKSGEVDFMADTTITQERSLFGYFSDSYRQETFSMYVRRNQYDLYRDKSLQEMFEMGFRLGATTGYVYNDEIESLKKDQRYLANFIYVDSNIKNYPALLDSRIDGFMEDSLIAGYELRKQRMSNDVVALPNEIFRSNISFMFSKKSVSPEVVEAFNLVLAKTKKTEAFQKSWLIGINN
jgi:polar amino acid transport system substrate-binding protein